MEFLTSIPTFFVAFDRKRVWFLFPYFSSFTMRKSTHLSIKNNHISLNYVSQVCALVQLCDFQCVLPWYLCVQLILC